MNKIFILIVVILSSCSLNEIDSSKKLFYVNEAFLLTPEKYESLKRDANNGDKTAAAKIAEHYAFGVSNVESSIGWYFKAAKLGDLNSQYAISTILLRSSNRAERQLGLYWLKKAAETDDHYRSILEGRRKDGEFTNLDDK